MANYNDNPISTIINIICPIIIIYSLFLLVGLFGNGIISILHSSIIFVCGILILSINADIKRLVSKILSIIITLLPLILLIYFISILLLITA